VSGARYDLAVAFYRDPAVAQAEGDDENGDGLARSDVASFPVHDDLERDRHRRQTSMGGTRVPSPHCDVDHDIRAVVMYEIVKLPSRWFGWCSAATTWNLALRV